MQTILTTFCKEKKTVKVQYIIMQMKSLVGSTDTEQQAAVALCGGKRHSRRCSRMMEREREMLFAKPSLGEDLHDNTFLGAQRSL